MGVDYKAGFSVLHTLFLRYFTSVIDLSISSTVVEEDQINFLHFILMFLVSVTIFFLVLFQKHKFAGKTSACIHMHSDCILL